MVSSVSLDARKVVLLDQKVLVLCFQALRAGAIYRFPFWERFLFCPSLRQTRCREDKSAQETLSCSLIGYEGWDSLMGWQLPINRTLPKGGGRREREAKQKAGTFQETTPSY